MRINIGRAKVERDQENVIEANIYTSRTKRTRCFCVYTGVTKAELYDKPDFGIKDYICLRQAADVRDTRRSFSSSINKAGCPRCVPCISEKLFAVFEVIVRVDRVQRLDTSY